MGDICQCGIICKGPCQGCNEAFFDIRDPNGNVLSKLRKKYPGFLKAAFTDADNFAIEFPPNIPSTHKALIMAAVIFMDYRYFEERHNRNNRNQGGFGGGFRIWL